VAQRISRGRAAREVRRAKQFQKFKLTELNLVPLVDTLVSIVFFALVTATVGELAPVVSGVNLPEARVGTNALQQLTLGVGRQVTLAGTLYTALRAKADSIRKVTLATPDEPVDAPLAIQGDRSMRYDLLSRIMQTARVAGFRNLSLQVRRVTDAAG
jgi:biopolymer transport protein ExbD